MALRRADFAGAWYPGDESECRRTIEDFSKDDVPCPSNGATSLGGIVPHAGWYFSGKIACNVIKCLSHNQTPDTCIIFGRHLHPGSPNYIMKEGAWATPLGDLEIDSKLAGLLSNEFSFNIETHSSYQQDNTIELQLPFIKYFWPQTKIVPIGVPPNNTSLEIGRRVAELSKNLGRQATILGSTDLTHYGSNYGFTPEGVGEKAVDWVKKINDKRVVDLMVEMDEGGVIGESLSNHNACCAGAAASAISAAKTLGANRAEKIIYSTSYDIRPDTSFVGYVGILFQVE